MIDLPQNAIIAKAARERLSFEQLRQEMANLNAPDPLLIASGDFDVESVVLKLLGVDRPIGERELCRLALLRALAMHPAIIGLGYRQDHTQPEEEPDSAMQALLAARDDVFARWWDFQDGMRRIGPMVCQICIHGRASGTGFLVGERHVLTTHHCLAQVLTHEGKAAPDSEVALSVRFDDMVVPGIVCDLFTSTYRVPKDWLVDSSACDDGEATAPTPLPNLRSGRLDYALILLDASAGLSAPKYQATMPRKWIDMTALAATPKPDMQMLVAHHPGGADLRLSVGLFDCHSNCASRVRYRTPAVLGSSGAPCFTIDWKPYALHNAGYKAARMNQGVPLTLIAAALTRTLGSVNFTAPPLALMALRTPEGAPILDREAVAQQVDRMLLGTSTLRALVVNSPPRGGKTFTGAQIRSLVIARGHTAFLLDAEKFAADTPAAFATRLVREIVQDVSDPAPASPDCRQRARWVTHSLSQWAYAAVAKAGGVLAGQRKVLLIILDRCDVVTLPQETHDLLVALLSEPDAPGPVSLRFMLLGFNGDVAAVPQENLWKADLDLLSTAAVKPFMKSVLSSLHVEEPEEMIHSNAETWLDAVRSVGCDDIPSVAKALLGWEATRHKKAVSTP